ncbi:hypothetical protein TW311 [Tropheryma whipplei TW08/27]|nr:hypothetical protein TW311 [Tropheryma whipplei TW08/27]
MGKDPGLDRFVGVNADIECLLLQVYTPGKTVLSNLRAML